jgi:hypothetical protein
MDKILEITKAEEIEGGEVVELPPFSSGKPFVAKLKTPSLLTLCANGAIPNELLAEAQDIYEGKDMQAGKIKAYSEVMIAVAKAVLVEPKYEEVAEYLNSRQLIAIYNYSQAGVSALKPFREVEKLLEDIGASGKNKKVGK